MQRPALRGRESVGRTTQPHGTARAGRPCSLQKVGKGLYLQAFSASARGRRRPSWGTPSSGARGARSGGLARAGGRPAPPSDAAAGRARARGGTAGLGRAYRRVRGLVHHRRGVVATAERLELAHGGLEVVRHHGPHVVPGKVVTAARDAPGRPAEARRITRRAPARSPPPLARERARRAARPAARRATPPPRRVARSRHGPRSRCAA